MFDTQLPSAALWLITTHHENPSIPVAMTLNLETDQEDRPVAAFCQAHFKDCQGEDIGAFPFTLRHARPERPEGFTFGPVEPVWRNVGNTVMALFLTKFFCSPYREENWDIFMRCYPHLARAHRLDHIQAITPRGREMTHRFDAKPMFLTESFSAMFGFLERSATRTKCEAFGLQQMYEFFHHRPEPESLH